MRTSNLTKLYRSRDGNTLTRALRVIRRGIHAPFGRHFIPSQSHWEMTCTVLIQYQMTRWRRDGSWITEGEGGHVRVRDELRASSFSRSLPDPFHVDGTSLCCRACVSPLLKIEIHKTVFQYLAMKRSPAPRPPFQFPSSLSLSKLSIQIPATESEEESDAF